jgi:hypothetical protein
MKNAGIWMLIAKEVVIKHLKKLLTIGFLRKL